MNGEVQLVGTQAAYFFSPMGVPITNFDTLWLSKCFVLRFSASGWKIACFSERILMTSRVVPCNPSGRQQSSITLSFQSQIHVN